MGCYVLLAIFCYIMFHIIFLCVFVYDKSWLSHSRHNFGIKGSINKHTHAFMRKPVMWTNMEICEIISVWDGKETTGNHNAKLSWKQTQVHCNYNTAWPNCGLHSLNCSVTATTNRPSAFNNHTTIRRGQSRIILSIAVDATESWQPLRYRQQMHEPDPAFFLCIKSK